MVTQSDYQEKEIKACFSVLLELMTVLGEFRDNIVLVGGNVPRMLIKEAKEKHIGTLDIDIALDLQCIKGDTYRTILETLKKRGYYQKLGTQLFVFFRDITDSSGKPITVEINLLAGEYGGVGKSHRHQRIQDVKARKARGCDLVFQNAVKVSLDGQLPSGAENSLIIKVAAIGSFLVTKGMALWETLKEKHAYDIYYCCKYYPGGLESLVEAIKPIIGNKLALEGLGKIRAKFSTINSVGPNWVADFKEISNPEEREIIKRESFEIVNTLMGKFGIESFKEE